MHTYFSDSIVTHLKLILAGFTPNAVSYPSTDTSVPTFAISFTSIGI